MWRAKQRTAKQRLIGGLGSDIPPEHLKFTAKEAQALLSDLQGTIILSTDPTYHQSRQLSDPAYQDFPQIIVYCQVFEDVRKSLAFARDHNMWVVCRSGGHSTAGYSINSEMVIDLSGLRYAVVDPRTRRATVGAGTDFGHLNATLDTYQMHVPSGGCEDVNVGGYCQGGGYGFTSRRYGMNCDNIIEAMVMLYSGDIVTANETVNPDLYWAIRGGTGNNFGVLLQVVYQLHDLWKVWGFGIQWPMANAAEALETMHSRYTHQAPSELGFMTMATWVNGEGGVYMRGMFCGERAEGLKAIQPLLEVNGAKLDIDKSGTYFEMNRYLLETPDLPAVPDLAAETKDCAYIAKPLGLDEWAHIVEALSRTPNQGSMLLLEPYGGRINEVPASANAFIHRDADFDLALDTFWLNQHQRAKCVRFLDEFFTEIAPYTNGHKYQNYPRRGNANYRWNYWGDSFPTLLAVKKKYDPHNFFHYPQSISAIPETADTSVRRSSAPLLFSVDRPIEYESYGRSRSTQAGG